jgi:transcription antitermination factor NusG
VNGNEMDQPLNSQAFLTPAITTSESSWYAVFTIPQNEKSAAKHLDIRDIESFCPTYEEIRVWKNRQRMKLVLPLFPGYLFVHITPRQRDKVLQSPGVLQIVGRKRTSSPLPDAEIELLRSAACRIEPYRDLLIGQSVRIKSGLMQGLQGVLVRKGNSMRFVLTVTLINQHAAIQVDAEDLQPILARDQHIDRLPHNFAPISG